MGEMIGSPSSTRPRTFDRLPRPRPVLNCDKDANRVGLLHVPEKKGAKLIIPLSEQLLRGSFAKGDTILVDADENGVTLIPKPRAKEPAGSGAESTG